MADLDHAIAMLRKDIRTRFADRCPVGRPDGYADPRAVRELDLRMIRSSIAAIRALRDVPSAEWYRKRHIEREPSFDVLGMIELMVQERDRRTNVFVRRWLATFDGPGGLNG